MAPGWALLTSLWFFAALGVPVIQQIAVALVVACTALLWPANAPFYGDAGFIVWGVIFPSLLILRPWLVIAVGLADIDVWQHTD